jgi:spore germination protein
MEQPKPYITSVQLLAFFICAIIGTGILTLPRETADIAKQDAWISVLMGGFLLMASVWLAISITRLYPQDTFDRYIKKILGPLLGQVVLFYMTFFLIMVTSFEIRQFVTVIKLFILDQTPIEAVAISILFCAYFVAKNGLAAVVRFTEVMLVPTKLGLLLLLSIAVTVIDMHELKPIMADVSQIIKAVPVAYFAYGGPEFLVGFIFPYLRQPERAMVWTFGAVAFVTVFYTFVTIISIGVFSAEELHYLVFPTTMILRTVELTGFLERLDAVGVILFIPSTFMVFLVFFYFSGFLVARQIGLEEPRSVLPLLTPLIYMLALVIPEAPIYYEIMEFIITIGFYYSTAGIFLIWAVAQFRRKMGESNS